MEAKDSIDLDLDALEPKQVQIKYKDQTISVNPLDTIMFAKLYNLSAEMAALENETDPEKVMSTYDKIDAFVKEAIPELKDDKLNQMQQIGLFNLLATINTPQDKAVKELASRGINLKKENATDPKASTS
jgi:hypothetical protein